MKISKVLDKFKNTTTLEKLNNFILPNIKNIKNLNILEFAFDEKTKTFIIEKGMEAVKEYYTKSPRPQRRYSVS